MEMGQKMEKYTKNGFIFVYQNFWILLQGVLLLKILDWIVKEKLLDLSNKLILIILIPHKTKDLSY